GFNPLETPIVERWEVLAAKYAGGEEILKETFRLRDQGGRELGLRYEMTTSLARFVALNPARKRPLKLYQIGPVFRDGPIKRGRLRQFWQCDVDTIGTKSLLADAELLNLTLDFFSELGLEVEIKLNNRKLLRDLIEPLVPPGLEPVSVILTLDKLEKIGPEGVAQELREKGLREEIDRLLGLATISGSNEERIARIRGMTESEGLQEIEELFRYLDRPERDQVVFTPSLARGLAYYTGTVFEVYLKDKDKDRGLASSLAAGGRYDDLIGRFVGTDEEIPAVGISFGLEPLMEAVKVKTSEIRSPRSKVEVFVIPIGTAAVEEGRAIAQRLRRAGLKTDMDLLGRGVSANLEYANAYGIPYALLVGPEELAQGRVKLRDMVSGEEELLTVEGVIARLSRGQSSL
ncbi:TPA: histidine--tRNA ligase, partial [Candidatus Bipolaricaulota bacterium]|nr:histidine--tRNA ligase [Candidatus Bipolaricaulota bacterium]